MKSHRNAKRKKLGDGSYPAT